MRVKKKQIDNVKKLHQRLYMVHSFDKEDDESERKRELKKVMRSSLQ